MNEYVEEKISPLELIQKLSVKEIDETIEQLNGELAALRQLRKVAAAKNGVSPVRGKPAGNSPEGTNGSSSSVEEKLVEAVAILEQEDRRLPLKELVQKVGWSANSSGRVKPYFESDPRFVLEQGDERGSKSTIWVILADKVPY